MANDGKNSNSSKFLIILKTTPWLNNMNVVFGHICKNKELLAQIEN